VSRLNHCALFCLTCLGSLLPTFSTAEEPKPEALKKGDRIVFLGDSITQGGGGKDGYITKIKEALDEKYKDLGIEVVNAGISGHKVSDLQTRVIRDVVNKQPTIVFIYIGINDVWHGDHNPPNGTTPEAFEAGLKEVIGKIQYGKIPQGETKPVGARVILCTPTVIGEKPTGNKLDPKLDAYADISRKVAKELKLPLCDLRKAFQAYLKEHNEKGEERGVLTSDSVHLNAAGNKLVAETMLKALGE
jgi:lysophospholipase L1-like esterase